VSRWQLAQINVGRLVAPYGSAPVAEFVAALPQINALADAQAGFVWRLTGEGDDATDVQAFDDPMLAMNMSVWESLEALAAFVYRTEHRDFMRRRREWFEAPDTAYMALWWVAAGHRPTPAEGRARLEALQRDGAAPFAFSFRQPFPAPGGVEETPILDECA
jgi:heme-degrading monooxygenase HmoA